LSFSQCQLDMIVPFFAEACMGHAKLEYSPDQVDAAGRALISPASHDQELAEALKIIGNWRVCHNHPLLTFRIGLERRAKKANARSIVAQRLKRLSSIKSKLERKDDLVLSQMQDIAGCRAVLGNVSQVRMVVDAYKKSWIRHKLERADDYIETPKYSGYRGIHLIYSYNSDRNDIYNGLKVEIQLRSQLQHAWATAVETVDLFTLQALKSGQGNRRWRRFFIYMSAFIASIESCNPVPNTPTEIAALKEAIRSFSERLDVIRQLEGFLAAMKITEQPGLGKAEIFLIQIDAETRITNLWGYRRDQIAEANEHYLRLELGSGKGKDQVLVESDSIAHLKRAYPNYFADTAMFLSVLKEAGKERKR
jgi:hypothetical protein